MSKYTEKFIQAKLWDHFFGVYKYMFVNMKYFSLENENDFIAVKDNGLTIEYEIKTRKVDFFDDFKKVSKHKKLEDAHKSKDKTKVYETANMFYYACPSGLIDKKEVPAYAGLIYVDENVVKVIKLAPLLHKNLWNPSMYFDRVYLKMRDFMNKEFLKVSEGFKLKRVNKKPYKPKKGSPKWKHEPQPKFKGLLVGEDL